MPLLSPVRRSAAPKAARAQTFMRQKLSAVGWTGKPVPPAEQSKNPESGITGDFQ
jgi:hypothetical protein